MIQDFKISELEEIMKIWLDTNIRTHDFIPEQYWLNNFALVKNLLPQADILVYKDNSIIQGFIGITNKSYIAGLFVADQFQSRGVGSALIDNCKQLYLFLELDVYVKNEIAVNFYKKHGFKIQKEKINVDTKEKEYSMVWRK